MSESLLFKVGESLHREIMEYLELGEEADISYPPFEGAKQSVEVLIEELEEIGDEEYAHYSYILPKEEAASVLLNVAPKLPNFEKWLDRVLTSRYESIREYYQGVEEENIYTAGMVLEFLPNCLAGAIAGSIFEDAAPRLAEALEGLPAEIAKKVKERQGVRPQDDAESLVAKLKEVVYELPGVIAKAWESFHPQYYSTAQVLTWGAPTTEDLAEAVAQEVTRLVRDKANYGEKVLLSLSESLIHERLKGAVRGTNIPRVDNLIDKHVPKMMETLEAYIQKRFTQQAQGIKVVKEVVKLLWKVYRSLENSEGSLDYGEAARALVFAERAVDYFNQAYTLLETSGLLDKLLSSKAKRALTETSSFLSEVEAAVERIVSYERGEFTDRETGSKLFLEEVQGMKFVDEGRAYSIEDILQMTKDELRRAFGGEAVAFVVAVEGSIYIYRDRFADLLNRWLFGKGDKGGAFDFFIQMTLRQPSTSEKVEAWRNLLSSMVDNILAEFLGAIIEGRELTPRAIKDMVLRFLRPFTADFASAHNLKQSVDDLLAYWKGLDVFANNAAEVLRRIGRGQRKAGGWLVYYFTTKLKDYINLGTRLDANPNSCFWTTTGGRSIPSLLVAQNVAVCYVFLLRDREDLERVGAPVIEEGYAKFTPTSDLWTFGDLVGRCFIVVNEEGKIARQEVGNSYIVQHYKDLTNFVWGGLRYLLNAEFGNIRITPTKWHYDTPNP